MKHHELMTWEQTRQLNIEVAQLAMMQAREIISGEKLHNSQGNKSARLVVRSGRSRDTDSSSRCENG